MEKDLKQGAKTRGCEHAHSLSYFSFFFLFFFNFKFLFGSYLRKNKIFFLYQVLVCWDPLEFYSTDQIFK